MGGGRQLPGRGEPEGAHRGGPAGGGFAAGREREEAQALWAAALRDAPRFRTPFDGAWFERLCRRTPRVCPGRSRAHRRCTTIATDQNQPVTRRESWGEAPDVAGFLGRASERALLRQWVLDEGSRLVAVLGLGGIGKSLLATRLAHDLAPSFERIFWRSLRDAPTPGEWLAEALRFLAPDDAREAGGEPASLRRLLELLGETRCLLVLDNVETVLQPGGRAGDYRPGYEGYGTLLRQLGEAPHRSCLVLTSREEPSELGPLRASAGPVRALELGGLGVDDGRALLGDKRLDGDEAAWQALIRAVRRQRPGAESRRRDDPRAVRRLDRRLPRVRDRDVGRDGRRRAPAPGAQVQRLSDPEHELLRRLAVAREPVGLAELAADLGPRFGRGAVLEAVEGLRRRSLLERTERGPLFGLHSVVLEYVTEQLDRGRRSRAGGRRAGPPAPPAPDEGDGEGLRPPEPGAADLRPDRGAAGRDVRERPGGRATAAGAAGRSSAGDHWTTRATARATS